LQQTAVKTDAVVQ